MDVGYVTLAEHKEFKEHMADVHERSNARLKKLESAIEQNNKLLISVERLATSMETMQKEQKEQGERLEALEARDGEMWRKVTGYIITAVIGVVVGYVFTQIGM